MTARARRTGRDEDARAAGWANASVRVGPRDETAGLPIAVLVAQHEPHAPGQHVDPFVAVVRTWFRAGAAGRDDDLPGLHPRRLHSDLMPQAQPGSASLGERDQPLLQLRGSRTRPRARCGQPVVVHGVHGKDLVQLPLAEDPAFDRRPRRGRDTPSTSSPPTATSPRGSPAATMRHSRCRHDASNLR